MAISRWMNKDVVYIYNGKLLNNKKEWNNVIWSKTDGPRGYYYLLSEVSQRKISWYHLYVYITYIYICICSFSCSFTLRLVL